MQVTRQCALQHQRPKSFHSVHMCHTHINCVPAAAAAAAAGGAAQIITAVLCRCTWLWPICCSWQGPCRGVQLQMSLRWRLPRHESNHMMRTACCILSCAEVEGRPSCLQIRLSWAA
jgi:hypothetical protein